MNVSVRVVGESERGAWIRRDRDKEGGRDLQSFDVKLGVFRGEVDFEVVVARVHDFAHRTLVEGRLTPAIDHDVRVHIV